MQTITGDLMVVERFDTSTMGNPRYICVMAGEVFYTKPNSSLGYSITNYLYKKVTIELGYHYGKLVINNIKLAD